MHSSFYTLKEATETHRKSCVLKDYLHIKPVYICKRHVFGRGCWQAYRINNSGDGRHPGLRQGVKEDMVQPTPGGTLVGNTVLGAICSKREFELMPSNGEWEPLQQKRGLKSGVSSGELGGGCPLGPLWKVWWRQRWKLKRESGEQKFALQKGIFWFVGNFTVQAARLCKRGNRNDHQIKEGTGVWKLHSYCSQRRKWHNMNPFEGQ